MNLANAIDNPTPYLQPSPINPVMNDKYESKSKLQQEPNSNDESKTKNPLSRSIIRYVSNACFNCRALHRRCNGQKICGNCKKRGIECVYKEPTKRGPKPKGEKKEGSSDETSPLQQHKRVKQEPKLLSDSREPLHIPQPSNLSPNTTRNSDTNPFVPYHGKHDEKGTNESEVRNLTSGATTSAHFQVMTSYSSNNSLQKKLNESHPKDSFNRNDAKVLLSSVTEDLGRIFPFASACPIDEHKAWYYWDLVSSGAGSVLANPAQFIEMGYYCALFMHGKGHHFFFF